MDHDENGLAAVDEDLTSSPPRVNNFSQLYEEARASSPNAPRMIVDSISVASASTLGTMFLDAESQEDQILKAELKQLEEDFEEQSNRLVDAESKARKFRDQLLKAQSERDELRELQDDTQTEVNSLRRQSGTVLGLDAALKAAIGEIDRLKKLQQKEDEDERDLEIDKSRLKVQALNLEVARLHDEIADERLDKERIRDQMESELIKMMEDLSEKTRDEFEQRLIDAMEEIKRLNLQLQAATNGTSSGPTDKEKLLQSELDQLKLELAEKRENCAEKEQQLQNELLQLQFELAQVRDSLQGTRSENERLREESQSQLEILEKELATSLEERNDLRSSFAKKGQVPREDVRKAVAHAVEPRDEQIKELKKKVNELSQTSKRAIEDRNWLKARLKVYQEESSLLQRQLIEQRKAVDHELQVTNSETRNAKAETDRLHKKLETTSSENQAVKKELEMLQGKLGRSRNQNAQSIANQSSIKAELSRLESVLETKDDEIRLLREQLEGAKGLITAQESQLNVAKKSNEAKQASSKLLVSTKELHQPADVPIESEANGTDDLSTSMDPHQHLDSFEDAITGLPEGVSITHTQSQEAEPTIENSAESVNEGKTETSQQEVGEEADDSKFDSESVDTPRARGGSDMHELQSFEEHVHIWPRSWHDNDGRSKYDGRNLVGYGTSVPKPMWPNMAKVALNFVIHFEEGSEICLLHGDSSSESRLTEVVGAQSLKGQRNVNMESLYDYGSRSGFWRLHRLFTSKQAKCTSFAAGMTLERNPQACIAMKESGWEVASHGYKLMDYQKSDKKTEQAHMDRTIAIHQKMLGDAPAGIFLGQPSTHSRKMAARKFYYDSDSYSDELPFWTIENGSPHLVIPYTLTLNDVRLVAPGGFANGTEFHDFLVETLDAMMVEGKAGRPKMMTIALHSRISGRPGRAAGISQFVDYAKSFGSDVWICTREDIARYWYDTYYPKGGGTPVGKTRVR